jgi:hypothetical protein
LLVFKQQKATIPRFLSYYYLILPSIPCHL